MERLAAATAAESMRLLPTLKLYKINVQLDMTGAQATDAKEETPRPAPTRGDGVPPTDDDKRMSEVRQRDPVRGEDRQPGGHRLHGRDRLQLGDRGDREQARAAVQASQLVLGRVPVEGDATVEPQRVRERLEVLALIAAADEVDVHIQRRVEPGDGLQQHGDVVLGGQAPDRAQPALQQLLD